MEEKFLEQFKLFYNNIHLPIQVLDEEGKIVFVNNPFKDCWKCEANDFNGYSVFNDIELKRTGMTNKIREAFQNKSPIFVDNYFDSLLNDKEITAPLFKTKIFKIVYQNKNYLVLEHEDRTETVLSQNEIQSAYEENKELNRLKDTFLSVLSHELRTPLNIILGYTSLIKESLEDKIDEQDAIYLNNLQSGSERLFKSLSQMLDYAQLESGSYKINLEELDLISILKTSITSIQEEAVKKNLEIKIKLEESPILVNVDLQCIENVLKNLLENAIKYTQQGYIEISTTTMKEKNIVLCKIKDSGIGIEASYLEHLFKPFSQENLEIGREFEGVGLGLALSKKYIEKIGGSLIIDSIKGVGSTLTFSIPLSKKAIKKERKEVITDQPKIFMIDDSGDSPDLLNAFLKNSFKIEAFSFRDFNLDDLKNEEYKIIIFDVNPHRWEQGLLICKDIKSHDPLKRPIVIISSEFVESKYKRFINAGANKFLVKPFSKEKFLNSLNKLVNA